MCLEFACVARQHAIALQYVDPPGENDFNPAAAVAKLVRGIDRFMRTGHMVSQSSVTTTMSSHHVVLLPSRHLKFTGALLRPPVVQHAHHSAGGVTCDNPG